MATNPANTEDGHVLYEVKHDELIEHFKKRAEYHTKKNQELVEKGDALQRKLKEQVDEADTITSRMETKGGTNYSSDSRDRDRFFDQAREHARKAVRFNFLLEHTQSASSFLYLNEDELISLEFYVSSYP